MGFMSLGACDTNSHNKGLDTKKLFRKYCVTCHGIDGSLKTNGAVDLRYSVLNLEERVLVISKGRNVMTAFEGVLTSDEINSIAKYTFELKVQVDDSK